MIAIGLSLLAAWFFGRQWGWRVGISVAIALVALTGWYFEQPLAALWDETILVLLALASWPPLVEPWVRAVMNKIPQFSISDTERMALESGTSL